MAAAIGYFSDQLTNASASPPVLNDHSNTGKPIKKWFSKTLTVAMVAASPDHIDLVKVPKGARFLGGVIVNNDADMEMDVGDGTTIDKYGNNLAADADAPKAFGNTIALGWGTVLTAELTIRASAVTADGAIGTVISGFVEYIE